jgi:GGDEF domain-containing protein
MLKPVEVENLQTLASRLAELRPKSYMFRDPVTNLYSLKFFLTRLEHAFERMKRRPDFLFAVMVIELGVDLPGDESLDYKEREQLLKTGAEILFRGFRPTDTFGRMDGERIVALYEDLKQPADIDVITKRLQGDLTGQYELSGRRVDVVARTGAALNHPDYQQAEQILHAATRALESALTPAD